MGCIFFFFISNSLLSRYFFVVVLHDSRILIARINAKNVLAMRSLKIASLLYATVKHLKMKLKPMNRLLIL